MTGIAKLRGISNKKGILLDFRCMTLGKIIAQKKKKNEREDKLLVYFTLLDSRANGQIGMNWNNGMTLT